MGQRRKRDENQHPKKEEAVAAEGEEGPEFEDAYADDYESEGEVIVHDEDGEGEQMEEAVDEDEVEEKKKVWFPGQDIAEDEELDFENDAYEMLHRLNVDWPCLSFDYLRDTLGVNRVKFPLTFYFVAGTMAERNKDNKVQLVKVSNLCRTRYDDDEFAEVDEEEEGDPVMESKEVPHNGIVNRIRSMPQHPHIVATWSSLGKVHMYNLDNPLKILKQPGSVAPENPKGPFYTFGGHLEEGYSMDWSKVVEGRFITGDCRKNIHLWNAREATFDVDQVPFVGHKASVEDLQWSPNEQNVFASCSVDQTIRIWDARKKNGSALGVHAHKTDVNVISWNAKVPYLMASGADDGSIRVWDLRSFKEGSPAAEFMWHKKAVTSIEWCPQESSMLAVSGEDDQVTIWDMSVEKDDEEMETAQSAEIEVPPQLLFIHQGQREVKEIHWHFQCPGIIGSTSATGMHLFKPAITEA